MACLVLSFLFLILGGIFLDRLYTSVTLISTAIVCLLLKFVARIQWFGKLLSVYAVLLLPFLPAAAGLFAGMGMWKYALAAVGGVLVLTAIFRFCPAYTLLGVRTCDIGKK